MNKCPVCGYAEEHSIVAKTKCIDTFDIFNWASCTNCSLQFVLNPPNAVDLHKYYFTDSKRIIFDKNSGLHDFFKKFFFRKEAAHFEQRLDSDSVVFDIGAGNGEFASYFKKKNYKVVAVDCFPVEQWALNNITYKCIDINDSSQLKSLFNYINCKKNVTIRHVLEHVIQPHHFMQACSQANVENILIIVPNSNSILKSIFGVYWWYWDPPRHLFQFNKKSIELLAQNAGYDVVDVSTYGIDEFFCSIYRFLRLKFPKREFNFLSPNSAMSALMTLFSYLFLNSVIRVNLKKSK